LATEVLFYRTGDEGLLSLWKASIAQRGDHALTGEALGVAVGLDELDEGSFFDDFGAEEHNRHRGGELRKKQG
jgi:hypothetical protein